MYHLEISEDVMFDIDEETCDIVGISLESDCGTNASISFVLSLEELKEIIAKLEDRTTFIVEQERRRAILAERRRKLEAI